MDFKLLRNFKFRSTRVIREIKEQEERLQIICLQEVDHYHDFYKGQLENLGYQSRVVYRRERWGGDRRNIDAVLIAWEEAQFEILQHSEIHHEDLI